MGLKLPALRFVRSALPAPKVLSLGYPDIVADNESVKRLFGVSCETFTDHGAWHGVDFPLPETLELFGKLGSTLDCIDIRASRGCERIVDLNFPVELGSYDLVIDGGTIEHCFHIGQALINAASAVKEGGHIFHCTPISMLNHGFYNVCPTLFYDFYQGNGWKIVRAAGVDAKDDEYEIPSVKRFQCPSELSLYLLARRMPGAGVDIPAQSKYRANPNLH